MKKKNLSNRTHLLSVFVAKIHRRIISEYCFILLLMIANIYHSSAITYQVGLTRTYTVPSQVASLVNDGDIVEIDSGDYIGDVAVWNANNLILRGVGAYAHLRANGNYAEGKAIWVIKGDNTTVENIEFSECAVPDNNGAGIRQEGTNLTVRYCYFHNNENGILTVDDANSTILVEHSEFAYNGYGQGFTHNIYVNRVGQFILRYCYMHHAIVGHNVKSRASENHILYNRIMDETTGNASMLLDLSNGGESYVIGNLFHQGANATNKRCLTYGLEGLTNTIPDLYLVNNTFVNDRFNGEFVVVQAGSNAEIINNIFAGAGTVLIGAANLTTNVNVGDPTTLNFTDLANYDYSLTENSTLVIDEGTNQNNTLTPTSEYIHPTQYITRAPGNPIDIGAYEYGDNTSCCAEALLYDDCLQLNYSATDDLFEIQGLLANYTIQILDANDNVYQTLPNSGSSLVIDINTLPAGLYFVQIVNNTYNEVSLKKILKMN